MVYTIHDIEWRETEIEDTVRFLSVANPKGYSGEQIKRHAFREWERGNYKFTFVGTAGWYVTIVEKGYESEKPFIALVSIMAYTAKGSLKIGDER